MGPLEAPLDARRRVGGSARDDRRLQAAARKDRRARLGHDRDLPARDHLRLRRATSARPTRRRSSTSSRCRACRSRSWSCAPGTTTGKEIPWDGEAMGELEVRGPWVAAGYYETPEQAERWTDDGWFKTGDIASFHPLGYVMIKDRSKDVIKSGGEWISSVDLENALMAHPGDRRGGRDRDPAREVGRAAARGLRAEGGRRRRRRTSCASSSRPTSPSSGCRTRSSSSTRSRRRLSASSERRHCGSSSRPNRSPRSADRGQDIRRHRRPLRPRRGDGADARGRGRDGRDRRPAGDRRHRRGGRARADRAARRAARRGQLRRDRRRGAGDRVPARPLPEGDRGEPDRDVQRPLHRGREDGRGRAGRGGNARRDRQHRLQRRLRRPDRPGRLQRPRRRAWPG